MSGDDTGFTGISDVDEQEGAGYAGSSGGGYDDPNEGAGYAGSSGAATTTRRRTASRTAPTT